ncbi:P-loop containing nucleoside triphosphate hydrolase protein [Trametes meyenii]|nr:P-loop containing nucleoside triphosphate hydrolase protein [Trametes meyenii]
MQIDEEYEAATKGMCSCPMCNEIQKLTPNTAFLSNTFHPSDKELQATDDVAQREDHYHGGPPPAKKPCKVNVLGLSGCSLGSSLNDDNMGDPTGTIHMSPTGRYSSKYTQYNREAMHVKFQGKENNGTNHGTQPGDYSAQPWKKGGSNVESSAKMVQMVRYLKEWECSGDKTIVFSTWTSMLDLCEEIFARNEIRNLRYDGSMNRDAREHTLNQFENPDGPRVLLISIKCGGVGLNLVSANRVINLDLSWNFATESQAYDRVHRLGQEKNVYVKRLVIKNTIEERMLTLQETKTHLADAALGEGSGHKLHKLSVKQIKDLFGMGRLQNERGQSQLPGA